MPSFRLRSRVNLLLLAGALLLAGCPTPPPAKPHQASTQPTYQGLAQLLRRVPTVRHVAPWDLPDFIRDRSPVALQVTTRHYHIYSTLQDPLILRQVPMLLESAFNAYARTVGGDVRLDKKLPVYIFSARRQWNDFTSYWAGPQAPLYLKIRSGAYYLNGACVTYHIGRRANFSILAHEGWHQFRDRVIRSNLPAWIDEGLATNFEAYQWKNGRVEFTPRTNGNRLWALRQALRTGTFLGLSELLTLEPGGIIARGSRNHDTEKNPRTAAYYAQVYALVRFLREYNYGQYLRRFHTLLTQARRAAWPLPGQLRAEALQRRHNPTRRWNALVGPWAFQAYIAPDPARIEPAYTDFCRNIASTVRSK